MQQLFITIRHKNYHDFRSTNLLYVCDIDCDVALHPALSSLLSQGEAQTFTRDKSPVKKCPEKNYRHSFDITLLPQQPTSKNETDPSSSRVVVLNRSQTHKRRLSQKEQTIGKEERGSLSRCWLESTGSTSIGVNCCQRCSLLVNVG